MAEPGEFTLLRQELVALNARAGQMNGELSQLSGALVHVSQLQEQARQTNQRVEQVAARAATHDDIAEIQRQRRRATRNLYAALTAGLAAVLAVGIGGVSAATAYRHQQDRAARNSYSNCQIRNSSTLASRGLIDALIKAEEHSPDPSAPAVVAALHDAQSKQLVVNCENLLKKG
jgi:hypothetical protein